VTNLSHIAEVTSPVFAAVAAYASYLSAMNGRRAKQEQHDPVLAGSPLQTTERDPNGCAPTRLEIINVGGPAFESAFALQAGANACSNTLGSGFLRINLEACVRTDMSPEGQIRALLACRSTDNKIHVCDHRNRRRVYPGTKHAPLPDIKRFWSDFFEDDLGEYERVACSVDLRL
jgi:hypothetical protein